MFLGVFFDENLKISQHIKLVLHKILNLTFILQNLLNFCTKMSFTIWYVSFPQAGVLCTTAAPADEKELICGDGEIIFNGFCYWADTTNSYTWSEAQDECRSRRLSLASVHSELEQAFIYGGPTLF